MTSSRLLMITLALASACDLQVAALSAEPKSAENPDDCGQGTPAELYRCNLGPLSRSEAKLKVATSRYFAVVEKLEAQVGSVYRIRESGAKAQEAWVKYRDAECDHLAKRVVGADGAWQELNCRRSMNEERAAHLEKLTKIDEGGESR